MSIAKSGADVTAINNRNTIKLLYNLLPSGRIPIIPPSAIPTVVGYTTRRFNLKNLYPSSMTTSSGLSDTSNTAILSDKP